jgi:hypothetical protein
MRSLVISRLVCVAILAAMTPAFGADLPLKPARPAPAASPPAIGTPAPSGGGLLAAPAETCQEWTDGCRVCQRPPGGEASCSNIGIACVPKDTQCTRP